MIDNVLDYISKALKPIAKLDLSREHWIAISVVVLVLGLVCMRGFGSRKTF